MKVTDRRPDNEETIIFWIGAGASPQLLQDLFGQDDFMSISPHTVRPLSFTRLPG